MSTRSTTAEHAAAAVTLCAALTLPAAIAFGRASLAVVLGFAVIALAAAALCGIRWPVWTRRTRLVLAVFAVVGVCWLPAIVGSLSPLTSLAALLRVLTMIAVGIALATFLAREQSPRCERIFLVAMLAAQAYACAALAGASWLLSFRSHGVAHPAMMLKASASAVACAIPLLVYAGWRLGGRWRLMAAVNVLLGLVIMLGTHSKSSLAGLLAAAVIVLLIAAPRFLRPWKVAGMAVALVLACIGGLTVLSKLTPATPLGGYHLFLPPQVIDQHRQVIWQFTLDRFAERPWFGWGLNVINDTPGAGDNIVGLKRAQYIPSHPHNWVLESLAEAGVVGALPLLAVVVGVAALAGRAYGRTADPAWLTWLALWLAYWSAGAFNFSMWNLSWQASGMVLAAIVCSRLPARAGA